MKRIWPGLKLSGVMALAAAALSFFAIKHTPQAPADSPAADALDAVAERHGLERVIDEPGRRAAAALLSPFAAISGEVVAIDAVMRRTDGVATLWLVDYRGRALGLRGAQGQRHMTDVPLLAVVIELDHAPDWPAFRQSAATPAPPYLPAPWHARLAAMSQYRMGVEGKVVAFFSQLESAALIYLAESTTSPEFHPGLRNSALAVDVQRALDLVAALPESPPIARFMRIDGARPDLPTTDRAPLERMHADIAERQTETRRVAEEAQRSMREAGEAFRRRAEADNERFRQHIAESSERLRARRESAAAPQPTDAPNPTDTDATTGGKSPADIAPGRE
jgi:hypothetical protein